MYSVLSEMTRLALSRPGVHATTVEIAEWYEAKARLHEHIAVGSAEPDADRERGYAVQAHAHAQQLRAVALAAAA